MRAIITLFVPPGLRPPLGLPREGQGVLPLQKPCPLQKVQQEEKVKAASVRKMNSSSSEFELFEGDGGGEIIMNETSLLAENNPAYCNTFVDTSEIR